MKKEMCDSCGKPMRTITSNYRFDEVGLPVLLKNVQVTECKECGIREPIIPNLDGLMHAIAFAVVTQPCKLTGEEVRFLRKYLGLIYMGMLTSMIEITSGRWISTPFRKNGRNILM